MRRETPLANSSSVCLDPNRAVPTSAPEPGKGETGPCLGIPPIDSGFPAFAARSSRVQYNGRKRRSCSPS